MADYQSMQGGYTPFDQYGAQFGWDDVDELDAALAQADQPPLRKLLNVVGSVASIALVAGVMTWGYNTIVRDVSGIPVVAASKEPVRVQPENPGGQ
ncbi:MAG: SPOR domain-containing protein, partial [Pseudomonadota bacterium]|nr:SPOR domain-containing protein [Pseudomonadota bacterium]